MHEEAQRPFTPITIDEGASSQQNLTRRNSETSETPQSLSATVSSAEDAGDWEIRISDLQICQHPDGRPIELGSGAFGKVP